MNILELFQYPFMQRALVAGVLLAALLAYLGVFVVMRKMAFFSDGMAHGSLAGVAAGVVFGANPLMTAVLASVVFAVGVFYLERKSNLSSDAVIGLLFTAGMALGVVIMSFKPGYQPELIGFLFGDILAIRRSDIALILILGAVIGALVLFHHRKVTLLMLDREMAHLSGMKTDWWELAVYVVLAVSIVLGIRILGVVLVSALLLIPVSIGKLMSQSFRALVFSSFVVSEVTVVGGLLFSAAFNLPTGAVIVLTGAALFFIVFVAKGGHSK